MKLFFAGIALFFALNCFADRELRLIDATGGAPLKVFMQAAVELAVTDEISIVMHKELPSAALKALDNGDADAVIIDRRFAEGRPHLLLAAEALVLYTHVANPVNKLSKAQVQEMLYAPHPTWKKINGLNLDIQRIALKNSTPSGTLMRRVFGNKVMDDNIFKVDSMSAGFTFVNPAAVFFAGFEPMPPRAMKVVYIDGIPPGSAGIIKGEYPLSLHYAIVYRQKNELLDELVKVLSKNKYRTVMKNSGLTVLLP